MARAKKIRVLIGDGRPTFRAGLKILLEKEKDFSIVGEVESADKVVKKVGTTKAQVVILHFILSESGGRSVLQSLQRNHPKTRVLVLTSSDKDEEQLRAIRLATVRVMPRTASVDQLVQCIRSNDAGPLPSGRSEAGDEGNPYYLSEDPDNSPLSARERQVVELVSQGFKNKEIAQRMFISEQTVKNHLHNIFDKIGVSDRLELALYAIHKHLQRAD